MIALAHAATAPKQGHEDGRKLLRQLFETHVGGEMPPIAIGERGKPYFEGHPIHFSITHTPNHVFCALSHRPIGIDAEELDRKFSLRVADKILSPTEKAQFDAATDKSRALLTFWVLKEAEAKCSGLGLRGYPDHTDFDLNDPRVSKIGECIVAVIQAEEPQVDDLTEPQEEADAL